MTKVQTQYSKSLESNQKNMEVNLTNQMQQILILLQALEYNPTRTHSDTNKRTRITSPQKTPPDKTMREKNLVPIQLTYDMEDIDDGLRQLQKSSLLAPSSPTPYATSDITTANTDLGIEDDNLHIAMRK